MADFDPAVEIVIENEGGYVDNPADPGGETNWGISKRSYPQLDIKSLTRDEAKTIYFRDYWTPGNFGILASQGVANYVFDKAVNQGIATAVRLLQQALQGFEVGPSMVDGVIGQLTAIASGRVPDEKLLPELRARFAEHHCRIVLNNPAEQRFLLGWLRRDCL